MRSRFVVSLVPLALFAAACGDTTSSSSSSPASAPATASAASMAKPSGAKTIAPEAIDAVRDGARKIEGSILVSGQALQTLTDLTDAYGPRLTGSDVHKQAAAWAADRFKSYGVDAALETFPIEHGWVRGDATAKVVTPTPRSLHVAAIAWTPGTTSPIRAQLFLLDDATTAGIAKSKADFQGKIVFIGEGKHEKGKRGHSGYEAVQAGAVAALYEQGDPANAFRATKVGGPKDALMTAPYLAIGHEDGEMVRRMLAKGPVTVEMTSSAQITGPTDVPNVIAEIKGREKPDEVVIIGAHLDSWDFANGAQDNGSGSAQVLEAARAIRAMGLAPRRTIRFALWGGEEEGLWGSRAYVKAHAAELDGIVAYINTDYGAGAPLGWDLDGRDDIETSAAPLVKSLLAGVGADTLETKLRCDTDHCPFWVQGVPTFNLDVDTTHYMEIHHMATDTVDKVKDASLSQGAAAVAVMAYAIAEMPDRVAPRLDHATVAKHLKDEGAELLPRLIEEGMWKP